SPRALRSDVVSASLQTSNTLSGSPEALEESAFGSLITRFGLRDVPAWGVSLGVHVLIMLAFAAITTTQQREEDTSIISELEEFEKQIAFDTTLTDQVGN